jgi:hypothetical protein
MGKRKNVKRNKRKEVKGDQHIKGSENQIFKSRFTMKRSWSETWRDYRKP